jgi:hypothetical protein
VRFDANDHDDIIFAPLAKVNRSLNEFHLCARDFTMQANCQGGDGIGLMDNLSSCVTKADRMYADELEPYQHGRVRRYGQSSGGGVYIIEFMASEGFDTLDDYSDMMK